MCTGNRGERGGWGLGRTCCGAWDGGEGGVIEGECEK